MGFFFLSLLSNLFIQKYMTFMLILYCDMHMRDRVRKKKVKNTQTHTHKYNTHLLIINKITFI